jgi:class 3 adenylate cyclase/tetratricopeptide (TPR) repeat protein
MPEAPPITLQRQTLERRVVTTLSCGLVCDATATSALVEFFDQAVTILQVMGGTVHFDAPNIVAANFGSRAMSETDAERAVLAALDLISARRDNARFGALDLHIGIASGLVWIKDPKTKISEGEYFSSIVSMQASALRELARSDTVLIAEATRGFVKGLFEYEAGEPLVLRNFSEPVRAFAVTRPSETENRFEALHSQRLRFLGRDRELSLLARLWRSACDGNGQIAFITGEQGIGKSRLASEAGHRFGPMPMARLRLFGSPNHQNSALYPFARLIERLCFFNRTDSVTVKTAKLEDFLTSQGLGAAEKALFSGLLGLSPGGSVLSGMNARKHRELLLQALLASIEAHARRGSLLIIFEDLHWADPTSRDLVELLVKQCRNISLLLVATARPEFAPRWSEEKAVSMVTLSPLTPGETSAFISLVSNNRDLPPPVRDHIVDCTGGVPLFVEEMTKVFIETGLPSGTDWRESGTLRTSLMALPVSIHAALLTRLDRLAEGKAVARVASVLGRRFSHALLEGVAGLDSEALHHGLARLIDAGLIFRRGAPPDADYMFKHALVREIAYSTLSSTDKKALHRCAAALLRDCDKKQSVEPESIAHHLTEGGENEEAARFWLLAGQLAVARSANLEAIENLKAGLKCLRKVEPSANRDNAERHLLIPLGAALMAVHGYGASEGHDIFERAAQLVDEATPVPERLHIICGLWNVRHGRSELHVALRLAEQFFDLAEAAGAGLTMGHCIMGQTLAAMGEFKRAQSHFLYVIGQYRDVECGPDNFRFTADEHILSLTYMGRILWALGYPEQAAAAIDEALYRARNGADVVSVAIALVGQAYMATHRGDIGELAVKIGEAVAHCSRYGLYLFEHWMLFNRGALLVEQGDPRSGIALMRSAIDAAESRQTRHFGVFQLSRIADAHLRLDAYAQALMVADEALSLAEKTGEKWSEAGVRRIRAEALLKSGRTREGQRELQSALAVARRQFARLEELRVATAMARHAVDEEELVAASQALGAVLATFEEGLDLPDLRAARDQLALLNLPRS